MPPLPCSSPYAILCDVELCYAANFLGIAHVYWYPNSAFMRKVRTRGEGTHCVQLLLFRAGEIPQGPSALTSA